MVSPESLKVSSPAGNNLSIYEHKYFPEKILEYLIIILAKEVRE